MIDHKGALNVDLVSAEGDGRLEGQISVAYGFTNHLAAQVYAGNLTNNHYQGMVGWYTPVGKLGHVDAYVGYGRQVTTHYVDEDNQGTSRDWSGAHNIIFAQGDIGIANGHPSWAPNLTLSTGLSLKAGWMGSDLSCRTTTDEIPLGTTHDKYSSLLFEPQVQFGIGWSWITLSLRGGLSMLASLNDGPMVPHWPFSLGIGISFRPF